MRRSSRTSLSDCCRSEAFAHGGVTRGRWRGDFNISRRPLETLSTAVAAPRQSALCLPRSWGRSIVRHGSGSAAFPIDPQDARGSGSGLGAAPWSEFALQRKPSVRQAALEHLPTPMPFTTGSFRACAASSGQRTMVVTEQFHVCAQADISVRNVRPHDGTCAWCRRSSLDIAIKADPGPLEFSTPPGVCIINTGSSHF